jgi:predicted aldo/keto reductase-like oxidoreductase
LSNARSTFAFIRSLNYAVPIWGIEREEELDEFLALEKDPPALDAEMLQVIEKDRAELSGAFCRGCGYCMPCPAGIEINVSARVMFLIKRSRSEQYLVPEWREKMDRIDGCISCGQCAERCPYELDPPALLKKQLSEYRAFAASR